MEFIEIRCQETNCPYHKQHCCFGEISAESIHNQEIIERHKCKHAKEKDKHKYVIIKISDEVA